MMGVMGAGPMRAAATGVSVCRLVVLALTLAGIVAMHGLASTNAAGQHRMTLDVTVTSAHRDTPPMIPAPVHRNTPIGTPPVHAVPPVHAAPADTLAPSGDNLTPAPDKQHERHELMAACVVILLGLLAALVLPLLRIYRGLDEILTATRRWSTAAAARAPPQPLFLSLCVFRN
jgi:hypothetical protein